MTDIVERLRCGVLTRHERRTTELEAADEIVRLRDTLAETTDSYWDCYEKQIIGAMKNTIDDHGPITKDLISSVMKRFRGLKEGNDPS